MGEVRTVVQMRFTGGMGGAESVALSLGSILSMEVENSIIYFILEKRSGEVACALMLEKLKEFNIKYKVFYTDKRFSLKLLKDLKHALEADSAQIVQAHCYKSAFYSLIIRSFLRTPIKNIFTLHGLFEKFTLNSLPIRLANMLAISMADMVVGCSREVASGYRRYPFLRKKVEVIQNCLLLAPRHELLAIAERRAAMRDKFARAYGLDKSALWVANIGRLTEQKNFPLYFEAIKKVIASGRLDGKVQFLVVGDGRLKDKLKDAVKALGIEGSVVFTGYVSDMDGLYCSMDVLALTSVWEGTPMCVLEAMAYGKPVVATSVGGVQDVIEDNKTGFLVKSGDSGSIAEIIEDLLSDNEKRLSVGRKAHDAIVQRHSQRTWSERHMRLFKEVLGIS